MQYIEESLSSYLPSLKTDFSHPRITTHSISSYNPPTPISNDSPSTQEENCRGKKSRKSKPVKSPSQKGEHIATPGFIIQLGFGLENCKIARTVNYERIPTRVVRKTTPALKNSVKKRGSLTNSSISLEQVPKSRRQRQSFTALMTSPRAPSARVLSAMKEIIPLVSSPVPVLVRSGIPLETDSQ